MAGVVLATSDICSRKRPTENDIPLRYGQICVKIWAKFSLIQPPVTLNVTTSFNLSQNG